MSNQTEATTAATHHDLCGERRGLLRHLAAALRPHELLQQPRHLRLRQRRLLLRPDLLSSRGSGVPEKENVSTDRALDILGSLCLADSDTDRFLRSSSLALGLGMAGSSFSRCLREFFQVPSVVLAARSLGTVGWGLSTLLFILTVQDTGLSTFFLVCVVATCRVWGLVLAAE